jgi:uncharacterized membrane protein
MSTEAARVARASGQRLRRVGAVAATALLCAVVAACARNEEPQESASTPPPPAETLPSAAPPSTTDAGPEGVLHAYYWECDGGLTLVMRNLLRENAITLNLHEGTRRLEQVPAASGAKYADQSIEFWTKGGTATYERKPAAPVNCTEVRARSLVEDARARGVIFRGRGNEPGWILEIGPGSALTYLANHAQDRHEYPSATATGDAMQRVYAAGEGDSSLSVTVKQAACADDMSGEAFDHSFEIVFGGQTLRGCGERLNPG